MLNRDAGREQQCQERYQYGTAPRRWYQHEQSKDRESSADQHRRHSSSRVQHRSRDRLYDWRVHADAVDRSAYLVDCPNDLYKPNGYLLGSYRIATAPEPNSSRLTSLKST